MSGLRRRLRKLEEELAADTVEVVCPECGEEFRIHADTGLAYIVWESTQGTGEKGYWKAPPDVLRVLAHDHDASLFVLKEDGSPWLGPRTPRVDRDLRKVCPACSGGIMMV